MSSVDFCNWRLYLWLIGGTICFWNNYVVRAAEFNLEIFLAIGNGVVGIEESCRRAYSTELACTDKHL